MRPFTRQMHVVLNTQTHQAIIHEKCHALHQSSTQAGHEGNLILWITEQPVDPVPGIKYIAPKHIRQILGQEFALVVYDISQGIRANTLYTVMGSIHLAGCLLLISPTLALASLPSALPQSFSTSPSSSLFHALISEQLSSFEQPYLHSADDLEEVLSRWLTQQHARISQILPLSVTSLLTEAQSQQYQQANTIARQINTTMSTFPAHSHSSQSSHSTQTIHDVESNIHVLIAERGRGKSYLLGIVCSLLDPNYCQHIIIVTQNHDATRAIRQGLAHYHIDEGSSERHFQINGISIALVAPDDPRLFAHSVDMPHQQTHSKTMMMVDEAASLPVHWLKRLTQHYPHLLFATTSSGYENNGLGFSLTFLPQLDHYYPHTLDKPIRFIAPCPMEAFSTALLQPPTWVQSSPAEQTANVFHLGLSDGCHHIERTRIAKDSRLRKAIMHCLMLAHYQTTPDDLQRLLDAPDMHCTIYILNEQLIGCVWIIAEGGFTQTDLCHNIANGTRRVNGHLSVQQLAYAYGTHQLLTRSIWRVNRIAILPEHQHQGHGSHMLEAIYTKAQRQQIDILTSAFGASPELINFWQQNGYFPIKLGQQHNAVTGRVNAIVARPVNDTASSPLWLHLHQQHRLTRQWDAFITDNNVDVQIGFELNDHILNMLNEFITDKRSFDYVEMYLFAYLHIQFDVTDKPLGNSPSNDVPKSYISANDILYQRYIQGAAIKPLINAHELSGKKAFIHSVKAELESLLARQG